MKHVVVIGGGMAGLASAYLLSKKGIKVTVVEKDRQLGGLAASFEEQGRIIPQSYHHILSKDTALVNIIKELGLYSRVEWKHIKLVFWIGHRYYDLSSPVDMLMLPLSIPDKVKFAVFMLRCFAKRDWSGLKMDARQWLDSWANQRIREAVFEPMSRIKFGVGTEKLSASWLGARLHAREGSSLFGYMPGTNWASAVVRELEKRIREKGGSFVTGSANKIIVRGSVKGVSVGKKEIRCDRVISTVPVPVLRKMGIKVKDVQYINTVSCVVGTKRKLPDFYWMVCAKPKLAFGGLFQLSSLNPTLGINGETVLNFFTNVETGNELAKKSDNEIFDIYSEDFGRMFAKELNPNWYKVFRIAYSSPKFVKGYANTKSDVKGLHLAGTYKEYPLLTSTGTALLSGLKAAKEVISSYRYRAG